MSKKINVSNSHPVGLASSHRDKGVFLVAEKNFKKIFQKRNKKETKQNKAKS
jgi:hypothetical protein